MGIHLAEQPENIVLEHLRALRADIGDIRGEMRTLKAEMAPKSDFQSPTREKGFELLRPARQP